MSIINKIIDEIENNIKEDVNALGFDIEYIEYLKEMDRYILRVVVEKIDKTNMDTEDCENISRKIEEKIDKLMKSEYVLEVSSPGFERALKNERLYKKYIGHNVFIKLFKKTDIMKDISLKEFEAILVGVENSKVTFKKKFENIDVTFTIELKDIAIGHTVFDYDKMFSECK